MIQRGWKSPVAMRVWVDDALVTRPAVTTAVSNGTFDSDLTGLDRPRRRLGNVGVGNGRLYVAHRHRLRQAHGGASRSQSRAAMSACSTRAAIERGPVVLRVGSTAGGDEYVAQTTLSTGAHSLSFTPSADFYIDLQGFRQAASLVNSVVVASSGVMEIPVPWVEADLKKIRWDQSGDVVFVARDGYRQRRIERRSATSWSVVVYESA